LLLSQEERLKNNFEWLVVSDEWARKEKKV
jgi:hypothetical protein